MSRQEEIIIHVLQTIAVILFSIGIFSIIFRLNEVEKKVEAIEEKICVEKICGEKTKKEKIKELKEEE